MLFKNATIARIKPDFHIDMEALYEGLKANEYVPARELESSRVGWVSPSDQDVDENLYFEQERATLLCLKFENKILPSSVLREELKERIKLREASGRKVRGREKENLLDEIRMEMLPKAFSKYSRVMGYIDHDRHEIVIGSASDNQVTDFLGMLRQSLGGSLPVFLVQSTTSPSLIMTRWLSSEQLPAKVRLGQEITMVDKNDGCRGSFRKQDLTSEEITTCLESGKQVERVALNWNDYLNLTIDQNLTLRKLAPGEDFNEEFDHEQQDDEYARIQVELFLVTSAIRSLTPRLYEWFDVESEPGSAVTQDSGNGDMGALDFGESFGVIEDDDEYEIEESDSSHAQDLDQYEEEAYIEPEEENQPT